MHGRLKIKTTAEQQEEKRKEREQKRKMYIKLFDAALQNNDPSTYLEFLKASSQVLAVNPDLVTFWNHRRKLILECVKENIEEVLENELSLTKLCLMKNPKSYCAWHHRAWVMENHPSPPWDKEQIICDEYLKLDERNFHCWDHRRFVVKGGKRKIEDELQVSQELIERNLSNYSAWHYRSKLLPYLHPPPQDSPHPIGEDSLVKELNMIVEAVFTDPSDQSPWFFLRWLINKQTGISRLQQACTSVRNNDGQIVCVYNRDVSVVSLPALSCENTSLDVNWTSLVQQQQQHSKIWLGKFPYRPSNECISLQLPDKNNTSLEMKILPNGEIFKKILGFKDHQLSELTTKTLIGVKDNLEALDEIDPDKKWVLLTFVDVLWALDFINHKSAIVKYLQKLQELDPLRTNYYRDMQSKLEFKIGLHEALNDENRTKFELSRANITRLYDCHHLSSFTSVDLSENRLSNLSALQSLVNCNELYLDGNEHVTDISPLFNLTNLQVLSFNNCGVADISMISGLKSMIKLTRLSLKGNPVCSEYEEQIKSYLSFVKTLEF